MFSGTLIVVEAVDVLPSKPVAVIVYVILPPGAAAFTVAYGIVFVPLSRGTVPTPLSIIQIQKFSVGIGFHFCSTQCVVHSDSQGLM